MDDKITVYVKSSALGKTGIYWQNASLEDQSEEEPELLEKRIIPKKTGGEAAVNDLINEYEKNLILMRDKQQLLLQVTGFESPERDKQMLRKVLNSLAWVADNNDEGEARLRYIAAKVLDDIWILKNFELQKIVNQAVTFDGKEAFKVDLEKINQFTQGKASQAGSASTKYCIQQYSNDGIEKLRDELQNQKLPKTWESWHEEQGIDAKTRDEGVLVIVTNRLLDPGILHKAGVWRGLAARVAEPEKKIPEKKIPEKKIPEKKIPEKKIPPVTIQPSPPPEPPTKKLSNHTAIVIVAIIILLGVVRILLFHPQPNQFSPKLTKPKKPVPVTPLENKSNSQQHQEVSTLLIAPEIQRTSSQQEQPNLDNTDTKGEMKK